STFDDVELDHCIVAGHVDDVAIGTYTVMANRCDLADGDFSGISGSGNFAADPLFRSPATGDLRLRWGSPCTDAATSAPPAGTLDLDGRTRDVDGDLDTNEVGDLGAFEFRPLELVGTGQLGSLLQWELWGPQGSASTLYWTRVALPGSPTSTPFGQLDL